jgi:L-alanine-DL-glutamate epimerase-like enolase superfamily enzyme
MENGEIVMPTAPGLGLDLDETALQKLAIN